MGQWNTSYRRGQYWEGNSTYRDMIQCVLNCTVTCARKWGGGKLGNKQLYGHVLKLVMQGYHIMERTVQTDGSIFTTDRTAECVVINKERHFDGCCNSCTQKCDEKSSSEGCNIWIPYKRNSAHVECESKMIPVITVRLEPFHNDSDSTWATYREGTKPRNYRN